VTRVRVLLADDHPAMLEHLVQLLQRQFEVVGTVRDGQALVEADAATHPDVIISDISMPILSGLEAANYLKTTDTKAKIIFLTVHDDPDYVSAALDAGVACYVVKSRMTTDLMTAIGKALEGQRFISPCVRRKRFS
jgi:DNA-binding NarL/FixJ family response regulator